MEHVRILKFEGSLCHDFELRETRIIDEKGRTSIPALLLVQNLHWMTK